MFGKDVQAYPKYGSEKKGLPTTYYLTIADSHIYTHSELEYVDLVVLNDTNALFSGNPLKGMVEGGAIFMQSHYKTPSDVWQRIPPHHKNTIKERKLRVLLTSTWSASPAKSPPSLTWKCGCRASCCWAVS